MAANYSLKRTAAYRRLRYHAVTRQRPLSSSVRARVLLMNSLKDRCTEARKSAGYKTVPPFAKEAGVKAATIYYIESGQTKAPDAGTLAAYARITGYSAEWLRTGLGSKQSGEDSVNYVRNSSEAGAFPIETWERLSPEARSLVLAVADFARTQPDEASLLSAYRACTPETRSVILAVAQAQAASSRKRHI